MSCAGLEIGKGGTASRAFEALYFEEDAVRVSEVRRQLLAYCATDTLADTVPQAIYTFLVSIDFEDSIRKAIYIGGDSDTLACINGSIAEAYYKGVPEDIKLQVMQRLDTKLLKVVEQFEKQYMHF